jgi:hypothetical protein
MSMSIIYLIVTRNRSAVSLLSEKKVECHVLCKGNDSNGLAIKSYLEPLGMQVFFHYDKDLFLEVGNFL